MPASATHGSGEPPLSQGPSPAPSGGAGLFVRLAVALTVALVLAMTALLWLRWSKVSEPTTAIIVAGDKSLSGAKVEVETAGLLGVRSGRVEATLKPENNYVVPIFRMPGHYHVTVTVPWMDRPIDEEDVSLDRLRGARIDLPTTVDVIGDSSVAGAQVVLATGSRVFSQKLTADDNFHSVFLVPPGEYSITVTRGSSTILEETFTIEPHVPHEIDLRRKA